MKMRNLLALGLIMFFPYACKKSSNECSSVNGQPTTAEVASVKSYLTSNNITATEDPRGFFYQVITPGSGGAPTASSNVTVKYIGTLTNGNVFDQTPGTETRTFNLSGLIAGWQLGIPLIQRGGVINLYLPPAMGYGCNAAGSVPSFSITIFHIELINF